MQKDLDSANSEYLNTRPSEVFKGPDGVSVAVWKKKSDDGSDTYALKVERRYKDKQGNYQTTPFFSDLEVLRVGRLLDRADDWIEKDKSKQKTSAAFPGM